MIPDRQSKVLAALKPGEFATVRQLCERTGLPRAAVYRALDVLKERGEVIMTLAGRSWIVEKVGR
jgi:DNA-binding IclR family transcriptional regulator